MANNCRKNLTNILRPAVSVIMTTRNRPRLIGKAIDCVLTQTLKNFELIITDGSSDNKTKKIVSRYNDSRIVYIKCEGNIARGRNIGLRHTRADYIAYCDDDEHFFPDRLRKLKAYLDKHPRTGLVYNDALWHNISKKTSFTVNTDFDKRRLEAECFFGAGNTMHRKRCIENVGYFDESLNIADDWDMWLKIADNFKIYHLPEILHKYLVHKTNKSLRKNDTANKEYRYVIKKRLKGAWNNKGARRYHAGQSSFCIIRNLVSFGNVAWACNLAEKFYRVIKNYQTIACLGFCELTKRRFNNAIRLFEASIKQAPSKIKKFDLWQKKNIADIKIQLIKCYLLTKNFKKAARLLKHV